MVSSARDLVGEIVASLLGSWSANGAAGVVTGLATNRFGGVSMREPRLLDAVRWTGDVCVTFVMCTQSRDQ